MGSTPSTDNCQRSLLVFDTDQVSATSLLAADNQAYVRLGCVMFRVSRGTAQS